MSPIRREPASLSPALTAVDDGGWKPQVTAMWAAWSGPLWDGPPLSDKQKLDTKEKGGAQAVQKVGQHGIRASPHVFPLGGKGKGR